MTFNNIWKRIPIKQTFRFVVRFVSATIFALGSMAFITALGMLPFPAVVMLCQYPHFSPIQKAWFPTYVRTEFSPFTEEYYHLLLLKEADNTFEIADDENVQPTKAQTSMGDLTGFALVEAERNAGAQLRLTMEAPVNNAYLWETLNKDVYHDQSIKDLGAEGIEKGFWLTFGAYLVILFSSLGMLMVRAVEYFYKVY